MRVIIFGASGMIGAGTLIECLADPRVTSVVVIGRTPTGVTHPKLREVLHTDFFDYSALTAEFANADACFFTLGTTAVGKDEATYTRLTFDLTLAAASAMATANPAMTFCYVSGDGTDSSEKGRTMWARVKGMTENALLALPFTASYMFRPALIFPRKGVRSKTGWYQTFYNVFGPFYPVFQLLFGRWVTTTENHGRAFIAVAEREYPRRILFSRDINALARRAS
jgi:uncharacterized protein YbjT (DUF2867 family)